MALVLRKAQRSWPGEWGPDDYDVGSGELSVGRIYKTANITPPHPPWFWTINGVHGDGMVQPNGNAHTCVEAMQQLAANWRKRLIRSGLKEADAEGEAKF